MEDILVFKIKSHRGFYNVEFVDDLPNDFSNGVVVIDRNVKSLFYAGLKDFIEIDPSESVKTIDTCLDLINKLTSAGFQRNQTLYAVGGGIIQDIVAFTASILYRGVKWEFVPTTLLAQCDSCIGSKTSINHNKVKNILGGFYPPCSIKICNKFLRTLTEKDIMSGKGEMLHYFLLLSEKMMKESDIIENIDFYINKSLYFKREMIEQDEFDKGERNLFNYGHTFGHAIETLSNYAVNHGQAVTMGMEIANRIALKMHMITDKKYRHMSAILQKNMPDYKIEDVDRYIEILRKDKKNTTGNLTCILLTHHFGSKREVEYEVVREVVEGIQ
jgi:3-dehydroquinate synthase